MIRRFIAVLIVLAVLGVAANDIWRYASAQTTLRDTTYNIARWAGENANAITRDQAAAQLVTMAGPSNVEVYLYDQTEQGVKVWTRKTVDGTIVAGTIANLLGGMSFSEARTAPFTITDYREAGFQ